MDKNLALHAAIAASDTENFGQLLHHPDVDINYKNHEGKTPLMASINKPFGSTMAMSLIRASCDVNCHDPNYSTPLHEAIENDLIDVAQELILRGADINKQTICQDTPLSRAIYTGNLEAVCLLLYYQADVNIPINIHKTHLLYAFELNWSNGICEMLLDYCDDFSFQNDAGDTALNYAVRSENPLAFDLLERGANVKSVDHEGETPLYFAIRHNRNGELFKLIWSQFEHDILLDNGCVLGRLIDDCHFSNSEWLECFYLILNSPVASTLLRDCVCYYFLPDNYTIFWNLIAVLKHRNMELKDRISIICICLSLGLQIEPDCFILNSFLFSSNLEFETVVYTGELGYNDYKQHIQLIFKELKYEIAAVYGEISSYFYTKLSEKSWCLLGFFSILPEEKKRYMTCIERSGSKPPKVFVEKLDMILQFPSLLELSRNQAQIFIEEKFKIVKVYQFFDVVKSLELPQVVKDIILFKKPIY